MKRATPLVFQFLLQVQGVGNGHGSDPGGGNGRGMSPFPDQAMTPVGDPRVIRGDQNAHDGIPFVPVPEAQRRGRDPLLR